jgi:hypothetical protein
VVMSLFSLGERLVWYDSNHVEKNKLIWDPQEKGGVESASVRCKSRATWMKFIASVSGRGKA